MITGQKLCDLYYKMSKENVVTTQDLKDVGIWDADIRKLVDQKKITRIKRGVYEVAKFDKLLGNDPKLLSDIQISIDYKNSKGKEINPTQADMHFVAKRYHEILSGLDMVLLDPMDQARRHIMHYIIKAYPDLSAFSINSDDPDKKYIVVKRKNFQEFIPDLTSIIKQGNDAYFANDYNTAIKCFKKIMVSSITKPYVFAKLGLSYVKKRKYSLAIKYLTIATILSKSEDNRYDFTNLLCSLKSKTNKDYMQTEEEIVALKSDNGYENNYCEIENLLELSRYISDNNLNVTEAWKALGTDDEKLGIIMLLYARDYYYRGFFEKGDQFFKAYERNENKSNFSKSLAKEIRTNRRFYKNRQNDMPLSLSLKLKP